MKKTLGMLVMVLFLLSNIGILLAAEQAKTTAVKGTAAEAEAMVKKAIEFVKANGKEKSLAEFSNPKGQFINGDLYITVYDLTGTCLANGANQKMVGQHLIDKKDPEGKAFIKERVEIAKSQGKGWQDYKFMNPVTKKVEPKSMYFEKFEEIIIACGFYKN